jgi:hypothetical protein
VGGAFLRTLPARLLDQRFGTFKRRVLITLPRAQALLFLCIFLTGC